MPKLMTYLGPSGEFVDPTTGLTWAVGETHEVSDKDAERLNPETTPWVVTDRGDSRYVPPPINQAEWRVEAEPRPASVRTPAAGDVPVSGSTEEE